METEAFSYVLGQCVLDLCDQIVEMIRDDSPDHAMAESFRSRVHRKHQPLRLDVTVFITLGKNDVLAWGELSPERDNAAVRAGASICAMAIVLSKCSIRKLLA